MTDSVAAKKYSLVIKARSTVEAHIAARDHGIELHFTDMHPKQDEVIASAYAKRVALQHWFNEDIWQEPPYPYGSLLAYKLIKKKHAVKQ